MAKAQFETFPGAAGEEPFHPATETPTDTILFGTPDITAHGVPGHWVVAGGKREFYPTREYVQSMRNSGTPPEPYHQ
jgi:hypothetical protein